MNSICAIILTKNEEKNIRTCIESIYDLVDDIVVIDSLSTDNTKLICSEFKKVRFIEHEWPGFAEQFNYALDNCEIKAKWILKLDADERLTKSACNDIREKLSQENNKIFGYRINFKIKFLGKYLKHGGCYPFSKLCLFRNGFGRMEIKKMDEHIVLSCGESAQLKEICLHENSNSISDFIIKHNKYSDYELEDFMNRRALEFKTNNLNKQDKKKSAKKYGFYYKMPMFLRSKFYYWYRYIFKLGFLDGKPGKIFLFLQAYWYRYLVDAKILEKEINEKNSNC